MSKDFKMTPSPEGMTDTGIHRLFDDELKPAKTFAAVLDRLEEVMHQPPEPTTVPELMFHTKKRHHYKFIRVPVGHDLGWACYDPNTYDGDPADGNCTMGYGKTDDEAYVDYLNQIEDEKPAPRSGRIVNMGNPESPPEVIDDAVTFDDDLEDR